MSDRELLSEAWKALLAAERQQADWSKVRDLRRRIETRMGEPSEGIDSLRKALSIADEKGGALTEEVEHLRGVLQQAQRVLHWGHREMRGRPPQHWLDALAAVDGALAETPQQTTEGKPHAG